MASAFVPSEFWLQDEWFAVSHARKVTVAFESWWVGFYGTPDDYTSAADEQHEYFVRAAFALMGWTAALGQAADVERSP